MHCIILEDEKPAQAILNNYIKKTPFLNLMGIYESGVDIAHEHMQKADLLFLDIQLPGINGLKYLQSLAHAPHVIVTTAFSHYAIDAFDAAVVDYLVKPFSYERFLTAVNRVRTLLPPSQSINADKIFIYTDKTFYNIAIKDIICIKSEGDYINVITDDETYLVLDSLKNWKEKLTGHQFIQCHRSYIVNLNKIEKCTNEKIHLHNSKIIPVSQTYKSQLIDSIKSFY